MATNKLPQLKFPEKDSPDYWQRIRMIRRQVTETDRSGKTAVELAKASGDRLSISLLKDAKEKGDKIQEEWAKRRKRPGKNIKAPDKFPTKEDLEKLLRQERGKENKSPKKD